MVDKEARGAGEEARGVGGVEEPGEAWRRELRPEDQARVDAFLKRGVNSVERKPFRPLLLLIVLMVVVMGLSLFSRWLAHWAGAY